MSKTVCTKYSVFENEQFGKIRTMIIDKVVWFVGIDVAKALGYSNCSRDVNRHVDEEDRQTIMIDTPEYRNGTPVNNYKSKTIVINESGLYSLILTSKLPEAKKFKRWVTSDVLPAINKYGMYAIDELLDNPDIAIAAFKKLKEEKEKNKLLTEQNEYLEFTNAVFAGEQQTWEQRSVINALLRQYSANIRLPFGQTWNRFYKSLEYKYGINLKLRKSKDDKPNSSKSLLSYLKEDELDSAVKLAVAMCEDIGMVIKEVIGRHNLLDSFHECA